MNCKKCGAQLSIEDESCRYCGTENEMAKKHQSDMKHYNKEFDQTKQVVMKTTSEIKQFYILVIVLMLLALVNMVAIFCKENWYRISRYFEQIEIENNIQDYSKLLSEYEEKGDYFALKELSEQKRLHRIDKLEEYSEVLTLSARYNNIYYEILSLTRCRNLDEWKTPDNTLRNITYELMRSYKIFSGKDKEYYPEAYEGKHLETIQNIQERTEGLLRVYCGMSDEEIQQLSQATEIQIPIIVGRSLGVYE